jgi:putative photosynthetic complex assembly protein
MSQSQANDAFPRAPLIGAALLVLCSLAVVSAVRWTGVGSSHNPDAATIAVRELRFEDRPDGSIAVTDARSGELVETVEGQQGFLRGTLRGLTRERRREGFGPEQPFRLVAHSDGRLTLEDPATRRRIDLESFGPTNESVFAAMLGPESQQGSVR